MVPRWRLMWHHGLRLDSPLARIIAAAIIATGLYLGWRIGIRLWGPIVSGNLVFNDLFAHWSYARFAATHPGPAIYDNVAIHAFQASLFDGKLQSLPYAYPPPYLFLVLPLAPFSLWHAAILWTLASVGAYLVALLHGRAAWGSWRLWPVLLATIGPATIICIAYGQNGLLIAALLIGGLRLLPTRPGWAGMLLAMACVKPQMAALLPVALLAGQQWRAIGAATITGLALVLASAAWIGPQAWLGWFDAIQSQGEYAATWINAYRQVTVAASMKLLGLGRPTGLLIQAAVAALVAIGVALAWRRGPTVPAACTLLAGTLLFTPYGFLYNLPVAAAAAFGLASTRRRLAWPEVAILTATLLLPAVLHLTNRFFWTGPLTLAALFLLCLLRSIRADASAPTPP